MSARPPEAALRRLVAGLALREEEDIRAVLSELDDDQRHRVEALLAACRGEDQAADTSDGAATPTPLVSDWLLHRLGRRSPPLGAKVIQMTPHARAALSRCAESLEPSTSALTGLKLRGRPAEGWWSRLTRQITQTRIAI